MEKSKYIQILNEICETFYVITIKKSKYDFYSYCLLACWLDKTLNMHNKMHYMQM